MPSRSSASDSIAAWRAGPAFTRRVRPARRAIAGADGSRFPETVREGEFDAAAADLECHDMAKRFAPEPPAPEASSNIDTPRFRLRRAPNPSADLQGDLQPDADPEREVRRARGPTRRFSPFRPAVPKSKAEQEPIWPGSAPAPPAEVLPDGPRRHPPGEELYNRAVAIVRADRKTSTEYLKERLDIRYMRAADLIDRMEQEGVLGAPVRNGTRPILRRMPRSRIV
jgi:DNA segregation ATPase FtsK/SpoIIIE-like protein